MIELVQPADSPHTVAATTHVVIIPSFNSGSLLAQTTLDALAHWPNVRVVLDGSTDGSGQAVAELAATHPGLRILNLARNSGKGAASLAAMQEASNAGFTHAMLMDGDGQHDPAAIPELIALSLANPAAMILGVPIFGPDAPPERVSGRRVGNWFANLETLWGGLNDSLFGLRLYPLAPAIAIMERIRTARRFDFDTELAVRMFWEGIRPLNHPTPVRYPPRNRGGVTHFRYLRDNLLLAQTHIRLCLLLLPRLATVWKLRNRWHHEPSSSPPRSPASRG